MSRKTGSLEKSMEPFFDKYESKSENLVNSTGSQGLTLTKKDWTTASVVISSVSRYHQNFCLVFQEFFCEKVWYNSLLHWSTFSMSQPDKISDSLIHVMTTGSFFWYTFRVFLYWNFENIGLTGYCQIIEWTLLQIEHLMFEEKHTVFKAHSIMCLRHIN